MSLENVDKEYIGQKLLSMGFPTWFRYMFRVIEDKPFIMEPIHDELLQVFDNIYNQKLTRINLNMPPRVAKTTLAKYFICFCLTKNSKCNFIYTSYSQLLLNGISKEIANILEHPVYKAMYPQKIEIKEQELNPVDDFWKAYLLQDQKENKYTARLITTSKGGQVLFASIGSSITGFGCAIRGAKTFTGGLILDDPNKPADIHSSVMREKVVRYFEETLLSRLNNPDAAILNIQQRLHLEDLSGVLKSKYNYTTISKPLIIDGICQLPRQYTEERIKELQANNYMFQAQYQQNPIVYGGGVFKHEWWKYYSTIDVSYKRLFMTADTAMKTNEWNDYTAIGVWGLTLDNKLYLLDLLHGKYEAPELESNFLALFEKWRHGIKGKSLSSVFIEDKASGTGLIQSLKRKGGLPIRPIMPEKDKLSRALDIVGYIASGNVYLPENDTNKISHEILSETDAFAADFSHKHDDLVDMIAYAVQQAYMKKGMF